MSGRGTRQAIIVVFLTCATLGVAPLRPALAEAGGFNCGREDHDRPTARDKGWFEIYQRRLSLAFDLRRNGNDELAGHFEVCALTALRRAAEYGHVEAQYQYGIRLGLRKPRTEESMAEAYEWLKKAAAGGHSRAKILVATWPHR